MAVNISCNILKEDLEHITAIQVWTRKSAGKASGVQDSGLLHKYMNLFTFPEAVSADYLTCCRHFHRSNSLINPSSYTTPLLTVLPMNTTPSSLL